jgi:hypothetical protein
MYRVQEYSIYGSFVGFHQAVSFKPIDLKNIFKMLLSSSVFCYLPQSRGNRGQCCIGAFLRCPLAQSS